MGEMTDYIAGVDERDRALMEQVHATAVRLVPEAVEGKSYGMPALRYRDSPLLAVMSVKGHIGLYPFSPPVIDAVAPDLDGYSVSKGTIRFTPDQPLPDGVVEKIVLLRRDEIDAAKSR